MGLCTNLTVTRCTTRQDTALVQVGTGLQPQRLSGSPRVTGLPLPSFLAWLPADPRLWEWLVSQELFSGVDASVFCDCSPSFSQGILTDSWLSLSAGFLLRKAS